MNYQHLDKQRQIKTMSKISKIIKITLKNYHLMEIKSYNKKFYNFIIKIINYWLQIKKIFKKINLTY